MTVISFTCSKLYKLCNCFVIIIVSKTRSTTESHSQAPKQLQCEPAHGKDAGSNWVVAPELLKYFNDKSVPSMMTCIKIQQASSKYKSNSKSHDNCKIRDMRQDVF